jgi:hypothetical protein
VRCPFWPSPAADAAAWSRARPITIADRPVLALSPADQLARSCWTAAHPAPACPIALADVAALLTGGDVDWEALVRLAATCHVGRTLLDVYEGLETMLGINAPDAVLTRLRALPVSPFEARESRVTIPVAAAVGRSRALAAAYAQYRRTAAAHNLPPRPWDFLTFLQYRQI